MKDNEHVWSNGSVIRYCRAYLEGELSVRYIKSSPPSGASGSAALAFADERQPRPLLPPLRLPLTLGIVLEEAAKGRVGLLSRGLATERRDDRVEHARGSVHLVGAWGYRVRGYSVG